MRGVRRSAPIRDSGDIAASVRILHPWAEYVQRCSKGVAAFGYDQPKLPGIAWRLSRRPADGAGTVPEPGDGRAVPHGGWPVRRRWQLALGPSPFNVGGGFNAGGGQFGTPPPSPGQGPAFLNIPPQADSQ